MLLERKDVNPNTAEDMSGRTPVMWAARSGCTGVVGILLEREDVDVNKKDKNGWAPLLWAAFRGHVGVVQVLLARKDIDTEVADIRYGLTALSWAALRGCGGAVGLLCGHDIAFDTEGPPVFCYPSNKASRGQLGRVKVHLDGQDISRIFPWYERATLDQ